MTDPGVTQAQIGARIAEARGQAGLTQEQLAGRTGMERTQLVRVESGERKVTVPELASLAAELNVPIDSFVSEPPAAVLSRRRDNASRHDTTARLDREVDRAARDVQFLLANGLLEISGGEPVPVPGDFRAAETLAMDVRRRLDLRDRPIHDLGDQAERLGLVWFSLALGDGADGACVELASPGGLRVGVAVVNGSEGPGRRRWTLGHELGHFLVGDAYAGDHPAGDVEQMINAFVAHFLMPRTGVQKLWDEFAGDGPHRVALALSARFFVSWSAACTHLGSLRLVDQATRDLLKDERPNKGDYLAVGEDWTEELAAPSISSRFRRWVLVGYRKGELSPARTVELLRGTLAFDELPIRLENEAGFERLSEP